jgi:hypothetical protein
MPGWFGPNRRVVETPLTGGLDPISLCLGLAIDGFAGYQLIRTTTTTTTRCSSCLGGFGTTVCPTVDLGIGGILKCIGTVTVGVGIIATTLPRVDVNIDVITWPITDVKTDDPRKDPNMCNCCEIAVDEQHTVLRNSKPMLKSQCGTSVYGKNLCVSRELNDGDRLK